MNPALRGKADAPDEPAIRIAIPLIDRAPARAPVASAVFDFGGATMGTTWSVRLATAGMPDIAALRAQMQGVLHRIVAQMSQWDPDSDLSRFNRAAPGSVWRVPADFATVLGAALEIQQLTGGAFDPALGRASEAWGFGTRIARPASRSAIAKAEETAEPCPAPVPFDPLTGTLIQPGGVVLDLCAIAKGYAVDAIAHALEDAGHRNWLVEVGGELRGAGLRDDGQPWWVDLETPPLACLQTGIVPLRLALFTGAVATSADHRRCHRITAPDGSSIRLGHTLDPRRKAPVRGGAESVSVWANDAMRADALATALMVMGPEAPAFARTHGIAARIILPTPAGFSEHLSPALAAMLD